jgi:hypothetical protein
MPLHPAVKPPFRLISPELRGYDADVRDTISPSQPWKTIRIFHPSFAVVRTGMGTTKSLQGRRGNPAFQGHDEG